MALNENSLIAMAIEIRRDHTTLLAMATALGLTELQVDEMFMEASKLQ